MLELRENIRSYEAKYFLLLVFNKYNKFLVLGKRFKSHTSIIFRGVCVPVVLLRHSKNIEKFNGRLLPTTSKKEVLRTFFFLICRS